MWRKWVMIAWWLLWHQETIWPERLKPKPDDWSIRIEGEAHLSKRWRKWTAKIATPRPSKHSQVYCPKDILPDEILPLVLLAQQGNLAARNKS
jgi:hypothetical protein